MRQRQEDRATIRERAGVASKRSLGSQSQVEGDCESEMNDMDWPNRRCEDGAMGWLPRTVERQSTWMVRLKLKSAENEIMIREAWKVKTAAEGVSPLLQGTRKPTRVRQGVDPASRNREARGDHVAKRMKTWRRSGRHDFSA